MPAPVIDTDGVIDFMSDGWWAGGSSLVLTYSSGGGAWTGYGPGEEPTDAAYSLFNATQRAAFEAGMELWDSYVAAEFNKSTSGAGTIRVAFTGIDDSGVWGHAYLPEPNNTPNKTYTGDIWVDEDMKTSDFAVGSFDFEALLHEIGHALGLDHSFRGLGEPASEGLPALYENTRYSIMSYTAPADGYTPLIEADGSGISVLFPTVAAITPMMFDILVVQDLYGRSTTTRTGATTYTFDPDAPSLQTIFDSSGVDTWNLGGHTRRSIIDLRAASFSSIDIFTIAQQIDAACDIWGEGYRSFFTADVFTAGDTFTWSNNVAIAYDTTIENVICGNAADSVTGNTAANVLTGNGGADKLNGAGGNDTLTGGLGIDTLTGGAGADKFLLNAAIAAGNRDTIKDFASGTDKINLENAVFAVGAAGTLGVGKFWVGANAHDANDRIVYDSSTGALFYDADGTGAGAKVQIALLTGAPAIVFSDFVVV